MTLRCMHFPVGWTLRPRLHPPTAPAELGEGRDVVVVRAHVRRFTAFFQLLSHPETSSATQPLLRNMAIQVSLVVVGNLEVPMSQIIERIFFADYPFFDLPIRPVLVLPWALIN